MGGRPVTPLKFPSSGRYDCLFLPPPALSVCMCLCHQVFYFSTPMLQINEDHIAALTKNEDVSSLTQNLSDVYTKVVENISKGQERVKKRKLAKGDNDNFMVGHKVLRKNIREEQRKGGKLEAEWLGPYVICNIEGKSAVLKSAKGNTVSKCNIDHLKQYVEPEERIPAIWLTSPPHLKRSTTAPSHLQRCSTAPSYLQRCSTAPSHLQRSSTAPSHLQRSSTAPRGLLPKVHHPTP